jgi:hypothetical protein
MKELKRKARALAMLCFAFAPLAASAQKKKSTHKGQIYFSWGYNTEWYTHSTLYVSQPAMGNAYSLDHVEAHDHKGWDEALFTKAISIPQYNYRLGFVFDDEHKLGFEINFDHTKYILSDQQAKIRGHLDNHPVDSSVAFNAANGFYYYLNNGANFLLFNLVKRWSLFQSNDRHLMVDFLGKVGVGPVIPHVQNSLFGNANTPHFQLGGWNAGIEAAFRVRFFRYIYLEYANKLDYARYSGLKIYEGTARQAFGTYEMILSLGVSIPAGKVK